MKFFVAAIIAAAFSATVLSSVAPAVAKGKTDLSNRTQAVEKAIDEAAK